MSLLKFVSKEEATGAVAEIYKVMEERVKFVPNVVQFHTASPEFFVKYMQIISHFTDHAVFDSKMIAYIRLLVSYRLGGKYCVKLQSAILKSFGVEGEDINMTLNDPSEMRLTMKDKSLVLFVLDMVTDKLENKRARIKGLRDLGFTDKDIYEASMVGSIQQAMVNLIKTFEVEPDFWMEQD